MSIAFPALSGAERKDTMKKGIPCFDNSVIGLKGQNRITFCFASGNEDIMPEITVSLGDMNPMTGEKITEGKGPSAGAATEDCFRLCP